MSWTTESQARCPPSSVRPTPGTSGCVKIAVGRAEWSAAALPTEHVVHGNPGLVLGDRRELCDGGHVAGCPDPLHARSHVLVHRDPELGSSRSRASRTLSASMFETRPDASSTCATRTSFDPFPSRGTMVARTASSSRRTLFTNEASSISTPSSSRAAGSSLVAVGSTRGAIRSAPWTIVTREPNRPKGLAELEPDRAAAEDEQRLGQLRELERRDMVDPVDLVDPVDGRRRPSASP